LYATHRFIIEFFRGDNRGSFIAGLSVSQIIGLVVVLVGVLWVTGILHRVFKKGVSLETSAD
jgi:prolipoprotein diacylglyceryltransferase